VPADALGVVINLTVVNTTPGGYASVSPGGAGFTGTSNLNWTDANSIVANSVTRAWTAGKIDVVIARGAADFIVDVFGYYR